MVRIMNAASMPHSEQRNMDNADVGGSKTHPTPPPGEAKNEAAAQYPAAAPPSSSAAPPNRRAVMMQMNRRDSTCTASTYASSSTSMRSILREGKYSTSSRSLKCGLPTSSSSPSLATMVPPADSSSTTTPVGSKRNVNFLDAMANDAFNENDQRYEDDGEFELDDLLKGSSNDGGDEDRAELESSLSHPLVGAMAEGSLQSAHSALRGSSEWSNWNDESGLKGLLGEGSASCHLDAAFLKGHDDNESESGVGGVPSLRRLSTFEKSMSAFSEMTFED